MAPRIRSSRSRAAALVVAVSLYTPCVASAQGGSTVLPTSGTLTDGRTSDKGALHGDAREFRAEIQGDRVMCVVVMEEPLIDGMFTCAHLAIDCDDKRETGVDGYELLIRAAVGSRFQPNKDAPTNGTMKAIEHLRSSKSTVEDDGHGSKRWIHSDLAADAPTVDGKELRFWFPKSLIREHGDRYHGRCAISVRVVTSCCDQPLEIVHTASDDGVPIKIDGTDGDWSAPAVDDPPDELHEHARCVDLTRLRVEHSADRLLACVNFAVPGFASWRQDEDVVGLPTVHFVVEPLFPTYQDGVRADVTGGTSQAEGRVREGAWFTVAGGACIEASFPRVVGQTRFRVIAHSEVNWVDGFGEFLRLDAEAGK